MANTLKNCFLPVCPLCKESLVPEDPFNSVRAINPATFRLAWMHSFCAEVAEEIVMEKSTQAEKYLAQVQEKNLS